MGAKTSSSSAIAESGSEAQRAKHLPALAAGERIATLALLEADGQLDPEGVQLRAEPIEKTLPRLGLRGHLRGRCAHNARPGTPEDRAGLVVVGGRQEAADGPGQACVEPFAIRPGKRAASGLPLGEPRRLAEGSGHVRAKESPATYHPGEGGHGDGRPLRGGREAIR